VVDAEPLQGGVAGLADVVRLPVDADPAAIWPALVAELGGQHHLLPAPGDRAAEQPLVGERPVHVGGVQEGHPDIQRPADGRDRLLVVGRPVGLAHAHAT
jgi:hypothetical protein